MWLSFIDIVRYRPALSIVPLLKRLLNGDVAIIGPFLEERRGSISLHETAALWRKSDRENVPPLGSRITHGNEVYRSLGSRQAIRMSDFTSLPLLKCREQGIHLLWRGSIIDQDGLMPIGGVFTGSLRQIEQGSLRDIYSRGGARFDVVTDKSPTRSKIALRALAGTMVSTNAWIARTGACLCRKHRPD